MGLLHLAELHLVWREKGVGSSFVLPISTSLDGHKRSFFIATDILVVQKVFDSLIISVGVNGEINSLVLHKCR